MPSYISFISAFSYYEINNQIQKDTIEAICIKITMKEEINHTVFLFLQNQKKTILLRVFSLFEVMRSKIEAFLNRQEMRDVFDIEFLIKKGFDIKASSDEIEQILKIISELKNKDYLVKLGSILDANQRKYYMTENFKILIMKLKALQYPSPSI